MKILNLLLVAVLFFAMSVQAKDIPWQSDAVSIQAQEQPVSAFLKDFL